MTLRDRAGRLRARHAEPMPIYGGAELLLVAHRRRPGPDDVAGHQRDHERRPAREGGCGLGGQQHRAAGRGRARRRDPRARSSSVFYRGHLGSGTRRRQLAQRSSTSPAVGGVASCRRTSQRVGPLRARATAASRSSDSQEFARQERGRPSVGARQGAAGAGLEPARQRSSEQHAERGDRRLRRRRQVSSFMSAMRHHLGSSEPGLMPLIGAVVRVRVPARSSQGVRTAMGGGPAAPPASDGGATAEHVPAARHAGGGPRRSRDPPRAGTRCTSRSTPSTPRRTPVTQPASDEPVSR